MHQGLKDMQKQPVRDHRHYKRSTGIRLTNDDSNEKLDFSSASSSDMDIDRKMTPPFPFCASLFIFSIRLALPQPPSC